MGRAFNEYSQVDDYQYGGAATATPRFLRAGLFFRKEFMEVGDGLDAFVEVFEIEFLVG
jgi:hypothetical protein